MARFAAYEEGGVEWNGSEPPVLPLPRRARDQVSA